MEDLSAGEEFNLIGTGRAAGGNQTISGIVFGFVQLGYEVLADFSGDLVEILFVPEAAGHATTFHGRRYNLESQGLEKCNRRRSRICGSLLTVAMVKNPIGPLRRGCIFPA